MPDAPIIHLALYLVAGALAGILAGLLGVGGGLVIVPALTFGFTVLGFPDATLVHLAVGTSLATIVSTSIASAFAHHRAKKVDWGIVRQLAPGLATGAVVGATVAGQVPGEVLRAVVGGFILIVAVRMGLKNPDVRAGANHAEKTAPKNAKRGAPALVGTGIGALSAIVGIGGGTLTVPYLLKQGETMHRAVAASAACGLPIAVAGTVGFVVTGWGEILPMGSFGYVHLPAFVLISMTSVLCAPVGARLAHRLPADTLKRWFAVFLVVVGGLMLAG